MDTNTPTSRKPRDVGHPPRRYTGLMWPTRPKGAIGCAAEKLCKGNALSTLPIKLGGLLVSVGEGRQHRVVEVSNEAPDVAWLQRANEVLRVNSGSMGRSRTSLTLPLILRLLYPIDI